MSFKEPPSSNKTDASDSVDAPVYTGRRMTIYRVQVSQIQRNGRIEGFKVTSTMFTDKEKAFKFAFEAQRQFTELSYFHGYKPYEEPTEDGCYSFGEDWEKECRIKTVEEELRLNEDIIHESESNDYDYDFDRDTLNNSL